MTDFIHEPPKDEQPPQEAVQEEQPLDETTGQKRVYGYIFILFLVAFSLLVWAFLMNQRSTDQVLTELRGNADALQVTLTRNVELEREVDALEQRVEALTKENERLSGRLSELDQQLEAEQSRTKVEALMWKLEYRFAQEDYDACRALAEELAPLRSDFPDDPALSARYEEIGAALKLLEAEAVENQNVSHET